MSLIAQGDFAMLGAFAMVVLAIDFELPYWLSILITLALLVGFGALFNLGVYYPLRNRSFLPVIIILWLIIGAVVAALIGGAMSTLHHP